MNYQNYEEYMRSTFGYSPYMGNEDTYNNEGETQYFQTPLELTQFYPDIYKIIYPMICKICNMNSNKEFTNDLLNEMADEIYENLEPDDGYKQEVLLKNGDVINPNAQEPELVETRQTNFLLKDLIKILIIREWEKMLRNRIKPSMNTGKSPQMWQEEYGYHRPVNRRNNRLFSRKPRYY